MANQKLTAFLKEFSPSDFKRFGVFINSPYFNKLSDVIRLYNALKKFHPAFPDKDIQAEDIFKLVYPSDKYNYGRFRVLSSRMLSLAKKFISYKNFESDGFRKKLSGLRETNLFNNKAIFIDSISETEKTAQLAEVKDENYYYGRYELAYMKNIAAGHFSGKAEYGEEVYSLTVHYFTSLLKTYVTWMNSHNSIDIPIDTTLIDEIEHIISSRPYIDNPLIKINYIIFKFAKDFENEIYFHELLKLQEEYPGSLSKTDMYELNVLLLNFCAVKAMNGYKKYNSHKFEIYKKMLTKELFFISSDFIPYEMYNNVVNSALEAGEVKWARGFVNEYKDKLLPEFRNDLYNFCKARISFYLKDYERVLESLAPISSIANPFYKFAVKDITIKTYYEMGYYENIFSIIDSYKHLLASTRLVNKDMKSSRRYFLNMLNRFIKIRMSNDKARAAEFAEKIISSPSFVQKEWLLEKAKELI